MCFYLLLLARTGCSRTVTSVGSYQGSHLASRGVLPVALRTAVWAVAGQEPPPPWEPRPEQKEADGSPAPLGKKSGSFEPQFGSLPSWLGSPLDFLDYRNIHFICICIFVCLFPFQIFWGSLITVYICLIIWKQAYKGRSWDTECYNHDCG